MKKLIYISIFLFFSTSISALTSSSFLISQLAFKNYDYPTSLSDLKINENNFSNSKLLDKIIAAVIVEDLSTANELSSQLMTKDKDNQEAYIVKLTYLYINKKFKKIKKLYSETKNKNELIDFLFFNNNELKNKSTISNSLIDIVTSSFSNAEQLSLNYNFLLFYTSLAKIMDENNDRAILIKGELFQNVEQYSVARKIFDTITVSSPYYLDAQRSLAINYSYDYEYDDAIKNIKIILEKNDNNYLLKKILADFYRVKKKYELAIPIYTEMIKEKQEDLWNIYYMRGICYERLDDWDKAEKDFLTSLDIKPESPNVLNYLAYGWVEREIKLDESLMMLKAAYNANPESFYIIDSLAWAYFKKNDLNEAARLMEKVIDLAPGEAISLDHLGDIYYAMNRKREAIHFWKQALELAEPEDEIEDKVRSKLDRFNAG
tara:strand:+ start:1354 stop:2652 length:1299 start_codon:yes stop_codon:yes gene_type:complete